MQLEGKFIYRPHKMRLRINVPDDQGLSLQDPSGKTYSARASHARETQPAQTTFGGLGESHR